VPEERICYIFDLDSREGDDDDDDDSEDRYSVDSYESGKCSTFSCQNVELFY